MKAKAKHERSTNSTEIILTRESKRQIACQGKVNPAKRPGILCKISRGSSFVYQRKNSSLQKQIFIQNPTAAEQKTDQLDSLQ